MAETDKQRLGRRGFLVGAGGLGAAGLALVAGCDDGESLNDAADSIPQNALDIAKSRELTEDELTGATRAHTPTGKLDEYYMFTSGGHGGQLWVVGVPSMRYLKCIPVFTPSPYQGFGYEEESIKMLQESSVGGKTMKVADTHHVGLSETDGKYDGEFCFINDKINARIAVVDLENFHTKQIVKNPFMLGDHGATVSPNTEYILESSQYAVPLGWEYAEMTEESYRKNYRGAAMFWKFDRGNGRIDEAKSFAVEMPPYHQDLADMGKLASDGWAFINSYNTELAITGTGEPLERTASANDMDYMHIINWKRAEEVVAEGKAEELHGSRIIRLDVAAAEGILYMMPEPKSPHGVDVTPNGEYIVAAGKLDPHVTIYSFQKIQDFIKAGKFEKDEYGIPIIDFNSVMEAQVELGLGPLHTQFDNDGNAYTSLFLDSAVAKWSLGGSYREDGWKLLETIPIQYNVGHVSVAGGDTVEPDGKYLCSLNKWSLEQYLPTGPHHTTSQQLIDISNPNGKMTHIAQAPCPEGEPHYAQMIKADKINALKIYEGTGTLAGSGEADPNAVLPGEEGVTREGSNVTVNMTVMRSSIKPDLIEVNQGDTVTFNVTNIEQAQNASHGVAMPVYDVSVGCAPGQSQSFTITVDVPGTFPYYCTEFCSAVHLEMMGYMLVKPTGQA